MILYVSLVLLFLSVHCALVFFSWALILTKRRLISCIGFDLWTGGFISPGIRRFVLSRTPAIRNADKRLLHHLRITNKQCGFFFGIYFAAAGKLKCNNSSSRGLPLTREHTWTEGRKCAIIEKCGNKALRHRTTEPPNHRTTTVSGLMNASLFPCLSPFAWFLHNTRGVCQVFGRMVYVYHIPYYKEGFAWWPARRGDKCSSGFKAALAINFYNVVET